MENSGARAMLRTKIDIRVKTLEDEGKGYRQNAHMESKKEVNERAREGGPGSDTFAVAKRR